MTAAPRLFRVENEGHISLEWGVTPNPGASNDQGRPVFDKVIKGTILAPSQTKSQPVVTLVRIDANGKRREYEPHYSHYAGQIAQFEKSDSGGDLQGTPIEEWAMIDAPFAATLKALKVFTVEQLAEASDTTLQHIGQGARMWKDKASNWLKAATDGAVVGKMTHELAQRDATIADLQRQLSELAARVEAQETKPQQQARRA